MAKTYQKDGKDVMSMTILAAVVFTRNLLKATIKDATEFCDKIRRFNFDTRVNAVANVVGYHMMKSTISSDGFGDWITVATDLKKTGYFSDTEPNDLAVILKTCWTDLINPENPAGGFSPDELYGTITLSEKYQPPKACEGDCEHCQPDEDAHEDPENEDPENEG
jgi:hypothetical protein